MLKARTTLTRVAAATAFAALGLSKPVFAAECNAQSQGACECDLTKLRPLQGALGIREVDYKAKKGKGLKVQIPVVFGPGNAFFVIDHHHTAAALLKAGKDRGECEVVNDEKNLPRSFTTSRDEKAFWHTLIEKKLVCLEDENGVEIPHTDQDLPPRLPRLLAQMPDDPYRSLVWLVRENGGICKGKDAPDFLEFSWADWFRPQYQKEKLQTLPWSPKDQDDTVDDAVKKARAATAKGLPGWCGI